MNGWDDPATARAYQEFETRHIRYALANRALARHAELRPGLAVLDLAAGCGGTVAAILPALGATGRMDAVEPAHAMAALGRRRFAADARVRWLDALDAAGSGYARITCGAAIWQWPNLDQLFAQLAARLAPGGALVFNIPAAYLGRADPPGGGSDPYLTALAGKIAALGRAAGSAPAPAQAVAPAVAPDVAPAVAQSGSAAPAGRTPRAINRALRAAGLVPRPWQQRQKLSQAAWRDWLKIPPVSAGLLPQATAHERAQLIDAAAADVDEQSWRPERWLGWTAWRPAFAVQTLADDTRLMERPAELRARAQARGVLRLTGVLPQPLIAALRAEMLRAARALDLIDTSGRWCGGVAAAAHEVRGWVELQAAVANSAAFQAVAGAARLRGVIEAVLGAPARRGGLGAVCRIAPPEHSVPATPAHRDSDYLRDAGDTWIAWLPLTPCGVPEGVLAVAPASHRGDPPAHWAAAALRPGDILLVHAHTLHRACPNLYATRCRLSLDLRFAAG